MQRPHRQPHGHDPRTITTVDNGSGQPLTFYPAYTFKASATWSKWVKLTAADIHTALKPHSKYSEVTTTLQPNGKEAGTGNSYRRRDDAPLLLFYLNHPIQFVQVIGVVVSVEEYFEKFWLFTLDDSSGATIDVTCRKPEKEQRQEEDNPGLHISGVNPIQDGTEKTVKSNSKPQSQLDTQDDEATEEQLLQSTLSTLQIGTVVQAKGTLRTFHSVRQLALLRLNVIPSTTHEMALISSRSQFLSSALSHPWTLGAAEQEKLQEEAHGERDRERERARKRRKRDSKRKKREERHARQIRDVYEREEEERRRAAEEARAAGEALKPDTPVPCHD